LRFNDGNLIPECTKMPDVPVVYPEIATADFSGLCPNRQEHKIHWVQIRYILFLQIIGPGRLHIPKVSSLIGAGGECRNL
jgi:hypothetical protein